MSYLDPHHINRIHNAYLTFENEDTFTAVVSNNEILNDSNARLSVQLFVKQNKIEEEVFGELIERWEKSSISLKKSMNELFKTLANG